MWLGDWGLAYWIASAIAPCIALFTHIHVGMQAASYFCAACVFFNVRDLGAGLLGRLQAASYFCAAWVFFMWLGDWGLVYWVACKQPRTFVLLGCFFNARGLGAGSLDRLQAASYFCAACVFFKVRDLGLAHWVACKQPRTFVLLACFLKLGV